VLYIFLHVHKATIASHISTILKREFAIKDERGMFHPTDLGKGLVEGYNKMGHQLARPYLRRAMERDCQKVARGELSRASMVTACLAEMKRVFLSCKAEIHLLDEGTVHNI
jgi:DNA topoisomerase-3